MTKTTHKRKSLFCAYSCRGTGVPHYHGREHSSRLEGTALEQQLRAGVLTHKWEERVHWGWWEAFKNLNFA